LWLIDMWRRQADSAESVDALLDLVQRWKPIVVATESGQIKSALGPWLKKRMDERRIYVATEVLPTKGDKSARCASIRGTMAVRGLRVPRNAPWYHDFRSELLAFPVGRHDDAVDATALVGQCIDRMHAGSPLPQKTPLKVFSTDPSLCTVSLEDLWSAQDRRWKKGAQRIR
jgi:predicted phage terminase large subunit-like protein